MFFKSVILLITSLYTVMTFRMLFVFASFEMNEELIRIELCEKRNVPDSCCKGKCYLDREMNNASANDNAENNSIPSISKDNLQCHIFAKEYDHVNSFTMSLFSDQAFSPSSLLIKPLSPPPREVI